MAKRHAAGVERAVRDAGRPVGAGAGHPAGRRGRPDPRQRVHRPGGRARTGRESGAVRCHRTANRSGARPLRSKLTRSCWNSAWIGTASSSSRRPAPSPRLRRTTCPTSLRSAPTCRRWGESPTPGGRSSMTLAEVHRFLHRRRVRSRYEDLGFAERFGAATASTARLEWPGHDSGRIRVANGG